MDIRLRAAKRAGELLAKTENAKTGPKRNSVVDNDLIPDVPTLEKMGISKDQSSQWQELAGVPQQEFEEELPVATGKPKTSSYYDEDVPGRLPASRRCWCTSLGVAGISYGCPSS